MAINSIFFKSNCVKVFDICLHTSTWTINYSKRCFLSIFLFICTLKYYLCSDQKFWFHASTVKWLLLTLLKVIYVYNADKLHHCLYAHKRQPLTILLVTVVTTRHQFYHQNPPSNLCSLSIINLQCKCMYKQRGNHHY